MMQSERTVHIFLYIVVLVLSVIIVFSGFRVRASKQNSGLGVVQARTAVVQTLVPPLVSLKGTNPLSERVALILVDWRRADRNMFLALWNTQDEVIQILDTLDPQCTLATNCEVRISPDGTRIAYFDNEGFLTLLDIAAMEARQVAVGGTPSDRYISWAPNSDSLVFVRDGDLYKLDTDPVSPALLLLNHKTRHYQTLLGQESSPLGLGAASPVWLDSNLVLFSDFDGPNVILGENLQDLKSAYAYDMSDSSSERRLVAHRQIIVCGGSARNTVILHDTTDKADLDWIVAVSANGGLSYVESIAHGNGCAWTNDGSRIAHVADSPNLEGFVVEVVDLQSATPIHTQYLIEGPVWGLVWLEGNNRILFGSDNTIRVLDFLTGTQFQLIRFEDNYRVKLVGRTAN